MKRKKYIAEKPCKEFMDRATTKKPIWAIELYITSLFILIWVSAKNVPRKVENNPKKSRISCRSMKNTFVEQMNLTKKQRIAILGMIEKIIVELRGAPS